MSEEMQLARIVLHEIEIARDEKPGSLENDYLLVTQVGKALRDITAGFIKDAFDEGYEDGKRDASDDDWEDAYEEGYNAGLVEGKAAASDAA